MIWITCVWLFQKDLILANCIHVYVNYIGSSDMQACIYIYIYILPLCMDKNTKVCVSHCFPPHNFRRAKLKMDSMEVKLFAGSQSELVDIACAFRSFTEVHSPAQ